MRLSRENVDLARASRCMTVTALAEAYGVSRTRMNMTLSRVTCGEIRPETAGKIAKILGVDVTEIIEQ